MSVLRLLEFYTQLRPSRYSILKYIKLHQRKNEPCCQEHCQEYLNRIKTHGVTNGHAARTLYFDGIALKTK